MSPKILVLRDKHDTLYFDVSSPEKHVAAMRYIFNMNQWRYADEPDPEVKQWIERGQNGYDDMAARVVALRNDDGNEYEMYSIEQLIDAMEEKYAA